MNPMGLLIAAVVALSVVASAYVKGRMDGKGLERANCLEGIAELNDRIKAANDLNRMLQKSRRQAFDDILEERRLNSERSAKDKAAAEAKFQQRIADYEKLLDDERSAARIKLAEQEIDVADLDGSCILDERDLDVMRHNPAAID